MPVDQPLRRPAVDRNQKQRRTRAITPTNHDLGAVGRPIGDSLTRDSFDIDRRRDRLSIRSVGRHDGEMPLSFAPDATATCCSIRRDGWRFGQCAVDVPPDFRRLSSPAVSTARRCCRRPRDRTSSSPAEARGLFVSQWDRQLIHLRFAIVGQPIRRAVRVHRVDVGFATVPTMRLPSRLAATDVN